MTTLAILHPIDPGSGTRVPVRVCSSQDPAATGAAGQVWWPAIYGQPVLSMALFDGDFTGTIEPAKASLGLRIDVLRNSKKFPRVERFDWSGAAVTLYRLVDGLPVTMAVMRVETFASEADALKLNLGVDTEWASADVLFREYAGTTGAEGGADLKGQPKPWAFGRCLNLEPVFIDQIDNVFQVSGYGPVSAIPMVYERGAAFGSSNMVENFPSYAALVAADIPEGKWGTCLAEGMFRLGAPPAGVITCDVDGDSTAGFLRRTGAVIKEIARRLGLADRIDADSLDALDAAVPFNVNFYLGQQITLLDFAQQVARPCNAVAGINLDGRLIAPRVAFGAQEMVLDAQCRQMPPVLNMVRQNTSPPYKRIRMGAARSWRVHSFDEIAFFSELVDRGAYDPSTVYREGNIVTRTDKSRWLYINPTAGSGNAPPTWPTLSNAHWEALEGPASLDAAIRNTAITIVDGDINGIGTGNGTPVDNGRVMISGVDSSLPAGDFIGQQITTTDTKEVKRWNGSSWVLVSDVTAGAQREIISEFAIVEIRRFEPGNVGNRTVGHYVRRGSGSIGGGTWSLVSLLLGGGSATVNGSTGLVTLSDITQSGTYRIRYVHTDGLAIELSVNVSFVPQASGTRSISASPPTVSWFEGETASRTVTHVAALDGTALTGGTWSLESVPAAITASINSSTGTVTVSGATDSAVYRVRYTHTDTVQTEANINVEFFAAGNPGNPTDPNWNTP